MGKKPLPVNDAKHVVGHLNLSHGNIQNMFMKTKKKRSDGSEADVVITNNKYPSCIKTLFEERFKFVVKCDYNHCGLIKWSARLFCVNSPKCSRIFTLSTTQRELLSDKGAVVKVKSNAENCNCEVNVVTGNIENVSNESELGGIGFDIIEEWLEEENEQIQEQIQQQIENIEPAYNQATNLTAFEQRNEKIQEKLAVESELIDKRRYQLKKVQEDCDRREAEINTKEVSLEKKRQEIQKEKELVLLKSQQGFNLVHVFELYEGIRESEEKPPKRRRGTVTGSENIKPLIEE